MTPMYKPPMDINVQLPTSCTYELDFAKSFQGVKIQEVAAFVDAVYKKLEGTECSFAQEIYEKKIVIKLALSAPICSSIFSHVNCYFEYTEENFSKRLEEAAFFVSDVWSKFPTLNLDRKKEFRRFGISLDDGVDIVSQETANQFRHCLKERIVKDVIKNRSIKLSTDNIAEHELLEVARPLFDVMCFVGLFPCKSATYLTLGKNAIELRMGF